MGKIKKILENELVGGTQSTNVYPITSVKAVYDENNERLDNIIKEIETDIDDLNANTGINEYPVFNPATDYAVGDVVNYEGKLYRFTAEHAAGEWIGTDAESWSLTSNIMSYGDTFSLRNNIFIKPDGTEDIDNRRPFCATPFLLVKGSEFIIVKSAFYNEYVSAVAFYDEDKKYISSLGGDKEGELNLCITKNDMPTNATYIRATSYTTYNGHVKIYISGVLSELEANIKANKKLIEANVSELEANVSELEVVANGYSSPNEDFSNKQYPWTPGFIGVNGNYNNYPSGGLDFMMTDYISTEGISTIKVREGYVNPYISPIAFYDKDKKFISAPLNENSYLTKDVDVEVPYDAAYMRFCSRQSKLSYFYFNFSPHLAIAANKTNIANNKIKIANNEAKISNNETKIANNEAKIAELTELLEVRTLKESEIIGEYVTAKGYLSSGQGGFGSFVYDISGLSGKLILITPVKDNEYVCVCRIEDSNGKLIDKYPLVNTRIDGTNKQAVTLDGNAAKCYVSITMKDGVANSSAIVLFHDAGGNVKELREKVEKIEDIVISDIGQTEIVVPSKLYAVVGDTLQIFYNSIFNVQNLSNYQISVICSKGKDYPRYFEYSPTPDDIGETDITFNLYKVVDCTTGNAELIASKKSKLVTVDTLNNNDTANIVCVGDSTTAGGEWVKELARRIYSKDGAPVGLGLTNVNICGRKQSVISDKLCGWEGTGGWTWGTYVSSPVKAFRMQVANVASVNIGAIYTGSNGAYYEVVEINVTDGVGNIRFTYTWNTPNQNELESNGVLTRRSGNGDESITYSSYEVENFSPFFVNGEVDFVDYANRYCNGIIDIMVVHLGINSLFGLKSDIKEHVHSLIITAKKFIDKYHEQFPDGKLVLVTPPKCSSTGGMAANYNATLTAVEEIYNRQMMQYHKAYIDLAANDLYKDWLFVANTNGEFDVPYGYPTTNKPVNNRATNITEKIGTNGVHPNSVGYYMIADNVYRILTGIIKRDL